MTAQTDPFTAVRLKSKQDGIEYSEEQSRHPQEQDSFSQVRIKQAEGFPFIKETGRHAIRLGSRIAETIGGIPGDISSLIQSGVFAGLEKLVGYPISKEARKEEKKYRAPTSRELKELSQEITKGYTSPKNPTENSIDEFTETVASLVGPMKFRRALGVSLGAQTAKEGLKISGFEEGSQEAGKLGTMFLLSTINPGGAMKYASSQYNKATELAKGASINSKNLEKNLVNLENKLLQGVTTSEKNTVLRPIKELIEKSKSGKIPIIELTAAKRDVNKIIGEPETLKGAKKLLKVLGKEIDNAIKPYEKINPEFSKAYRPANEIYGAVMQGNKASRFIQSTLGPKSILGVVLAETTLGHPEYILPTASAAAGALMGAKSADFFSRMMRSPELRKFYAKALVAAAAEDASALRLYAEKIEKELEKPNNQVH